MSSKQKKKDSSQSKTTIVQDILNKDISMNNNNFIFLISFGYAIAIVFNWELIMFKMSGFISFLK